jgi:hypothetical protein
VSRCTASTIYVAGLKVRFATHRVWRATGDGGWAPVRHWSDLADGGQVRVVDRRHRPDRAPEGCHLDVYVAAGTSRGRAGRQTPPPVFASAAQRAAAAVVVMTDAHWDVIDTFGGHVELGEDLAGHPATTDRTLWTLRCLGVDPFHFLVNPSTPPELLVDLAESGEPLGAASHPNWPADRPLPADLFDCGGGLWPGVDVNRTVFDQAVALLPSACIPSLASHPATPTAVLETILNRGGLSPTSRACVLQHPNISPDVLRKRFRRVELRAAIVANPVCPQELLHAGFETFQSLDARERAAFGWNLASNPSTPVEVLAALAARRDDSAWCALRNPNTPLPVVRRALSSALQEERQAALANPALPADEVEHHVRTHPEDLVFRGSAVPAAVGPETLVWAATRVDPLALQQHPALPPSHRLVAHCWGETAVNELLHVAGRVSPDGMAFVAANWDRWPGTVDELVDAANAVAG